MHPFLCDISFTIPDLMCNQAWQERYHARIEILRMITSMVFRHHWYAVRPGGQSSR